MGLIIEARNLAKQAHQGQFRKYMNKVPYFVHPERVAIDILKLPDSTEAMVAAAYLHDTIEDCGLSAKYIQQRFGPEVAELVVGLTSYSKQVSISHVRAFRKAADLDYLSKQKKEVHIIKLADRADNLADMGTCDDRDFVLLYCQESEALLNVIGYANEDLAERITKEIYWHRTFYGVEKSNNPISVQPAPVHRSSIGSNF